MTEYDHLDSFLPTCCGICRAIFFADLIFWWLRPPVLPSWDPYGVEVRP